MSTPTRRDPRRPFVLSSGGVRRIALERKAADVTAPQTKPLRTSRPPKAWHMAIAYADRGALDEGGRQALAAAAILADDDTGVLAVVLGPLEQDLGPMGADVVAVLSDCSATSYAPERDLAAVLALTERYAPKQMFMSESLRGEADLGRRLAMALGASVATHVLELNRDSVLSAWHGGAARARSALPRVVLLETGAVDSELPFAGEARVIESTGPLHGAASLIRDLGITPPDRLAVALEEADAVVSAGNGVRNDATIEALAAELGAAVGASRVAVDDGRYPRARQIGASGKTVSASLYVAAGISGAIQHLQGIKDCRHVIAINRDAAAPIVKRADLTVVGDAEEIMQALITRIGQAKTQREDAP